MRDEINNAIEAALKALPNVEVSDTSHGWVVTTPEGEDFYVEAAF